LDEEKEAKHEINLTALTIIVVIFLSAAIFAILSQVYPGTIALLSGPNYVSGGAIFDAVYVILTIASYGIYLFGGGVIMFGAILVTANFIRSKIKDPYKPSLSTSHLSGYLTLGLNFFIGAEIIRTVATRTLPEFELLFLVIFSRGIFSLILYLEKRWSGNEETE